MIAEIEAVVAQLSSGKGLDMDDGEESEWRPDVAQATIAEHDTGHIPTSKSGWLSKQGKPGATSLMLCGDRGL